MKLKTKIFLLAFILITFCSYGQNNSNANPDPVVNKDSIAYIKKCIEFIKKVERRELSNASFILRDEVYSLQAFSLGPFNCLSDLLADTFFTKDELSFIRDKKYPSLTKWTTALFENIKLISSDTIDLIFKDGASGWGYFYKNIGRSFNEFSEPIFLRDDTYCLFYSSHHCGRLCGSGQLSLYKKEKNKWVTVKTYCNWIS